MSLEDAAGVQEVVLLALLTHRGTDPTAVERLLTGQALMLGLMASPSNRAMMHVGHSRGALETILRSSR
jgi:DMSO reductase anchor subunit